MKLSLKSALATIAAIGLLTAGLSVPAQAAGESIDVVITDDTLTGSTISGYDPGVTLRVALIAELGRLVWENNGSGASLVSYDGSQSQSLWLEGTQDQLNAALGEISILKPCSGSYRIYAQVSADTLLENPLNGHLYKTVYNSLYFNDAFNEANQTPLQQGGTDTFGYLATISNPIENTIVSNLLTPYTWFGATDRDVDGDWTWISGPEAGQVFYRGMANQGGEPVDGKYSNWNGGEPNGGTDENYPEMLGGGKWNDINDSARYYTIEWGGMPGDNLTSASVKSDYADISITSVITGLGTEENPYRVNNAEALAATSGCGGEGVKFLQTADITLPADWAGNGTMNGYFEGNGWTITYSPNTVITHDNFGVWANAGNDFDSEIHNVTVVGDLDAHGYNRVGLLLGESNALIYDTAVSGSINVSDERQYIGGVVGRAWRDMIRVTSTVNITGGAADYLGGVVGEMDATLNNVTWSGSINIDSQDENFNYYVGGVAGLMDCGGSENSSSSGTITISGHYYGVGGLVGNGCGWITRSYSSVDIVANGSTNIGGLIGETDAEIWRTFATGDVAGFEGVGGLIGVAVGNDIYNNYARGDVNAVNYAGSIFGELRWSWIENLYATGHVTAGESRGAIGRFAGSPSIQRLHWAPTQAAVDVPGDLRNGEVPFTEAESKDWAYYLGDGWDISTIWDEGYSWTICEAFNDGYPFITSLYSEDPCLQVQSLTPFAVISGSGVEGETLTGSSGTWDAGTTQTLQWRRNNTPIDGATATTYIPVAGDVGNTITFVVTSTKPGYQNVMRYSIGITITAKPEVVVPPKKNTKLSVAVGGFAGNSWWVPKGFAAAIKKAGKAHAKATTVTCTGIVAPGGTATWQKTLGLKRAVLGCAFVISNNPKLKVKLAWKVAKKSDAVLRGVELKFNK